MASRIVMLAAWIAIASAAPAASRADYSVTDLGPSAAGSQGHGNAINNNGMVAGTSYNNGQSGAFYVNPGTTAMVTISTLGGSSNTGLGVNDSGQVTGASQIPGNNNLTHAFVANPGGGVTDLGTLTGTGSSTGYAINNSGVVVGQSSASIGQHAFLYSNGAMNDLGTLAGGTNSAAYAINGLGHVVGMSQSTQGVQGFFYDGSTMHALGSFVSGMGSYAQGINNLDHVVGYGVNAQGYDQAFIDYNPTVPNSLQTLVGFPSVVQSLAFGINRFDDVVGEVQLAGGAFHAFLWTPSGGMVDLNSLLPPDFGGVLDDATAINDAGQITGYYTVDGQIHAFLLSPPSVPAPPSIVLMTVGILGLAARFRSRFRGGRTGSPAPDAPSVASPGC